MPFPAMLFGHPAIAQTRVLLRRFAQQALGGHPVRAAGMLLRDGSSLVRTRLVPSEVRLLRRDLVQVHASRETLYLQWEHARHLRRFRPAFLATGLHDKAQFARFCKSADLPHPRTQALASRDAETIYRTMQAIGTAEIIVKPATGSSGQGLALLRRTSDEQWRMTRRGSPPAQSATPAELLAGHCPGATLVLQPLLQNHSDLAQSAGPMLATFRIVTRRMSDEEDDAVAVLSALAELPLTEEEPMPACWAILPANMQTGRLGRLSTDIATELEPAMAERARRYDDITIDDLPELALLACRAHRAVIDTHGTNLPPMIGWDMALTPSGPMVLELNWNWAVAAHYRTMAGFDPTPSALFRRAADLGGANSSA